MSIEEMEKINLLFKEGKSLFYIWKEFPRYSFSELFSIIKSYEDIEVQNIRQEISGRLKSIVMADSKEKAEIIEEVNELINSICDKHKRNSNRLDDLRRIILNYL